MVFNNGFPFTLKYVCVCLYKKTKVRAYGSITSWQIEGEIVEAVADFISGGSRITADGDCRN